MPIIEHRSEFSGKSPLGVNAYLEGKENIPSVFLSRYGQRISRRFVERIISQYAKVAGLKRDVWPHLIRHSFATHMLENGAGIRQIQELLGHASITTTQIYTHVTGEEARKSLQAFHPRAKEVEVKEEGEG